MVVRRPGMWAPGAIATGSLLWSILEDLGFIDECRDEVVAAVRAVEWRFGSLGSRVMADWFADSNGMGEVASVLAQVAAEFGFLAAPVVSTNDWTSLVDSLGRFVERDWTRAEVDSAFAPASLRINGDRIYGFRPSKAANWVFVDFIGDSGAAFVRSVRMGSSRIEQVLFTPAGSAQQAKR